jgi:hypothetical protein
VAQFRVEFVLDTASGMYLAELYHPENEDEILVSTEPLYSTQAAALLGVVQLFKEAIGETPRRKAKAKAKRAARRKKPAPRKAVRKAAKRRKHR